MSVRVMSNMPSEWHECWNFLVQNKFLFEDTTLKKSRHGNHIKKTKKKQKNREEKDHPRTTEKVSVIHFEKKNRCTDESRQCNGMKSGP